jgi:hypothetical protein
VFLALSSSLRFVVVVVVDDDDVFFDFGKSRNNKEAEEAAEAVFVFFSFKLDSIKEGRKTEEMAVLRVLVLGDVGGTIVAAVVTMVG